MVYRSIWEDTYYDTTEDTLSYSIECDGVTIFSAKAYKVPTADTLRININKVCSNYVDNYDITDILSGKAEEQDSTMAIRTFSLNNDDTEETLEQYTFLYDWSYDNRYRGEYMTLSHPINGNRAENMLTINTDASDEGYAINVFDNEQYPNEKLCKEYALYYLNSYGGWDCFLIEGNTVKKDTITQYNTDHNYDNNTLDFETDRYMTEVVTSYEMHTGYLNDEQCANMAKNLFSSNKVYVHNLVNDEISPVVITDTSVSYLTYANNGKKLCSYTINIKESQSKLRK